MTETAGKYKLGEHPNSLRNLALSSGRKAEYGQKKKNRTTSLTDEAWDSLKQLADEHNCSGVSDLFEKVGRGMITLNSETSS